MLIVAFRQSVRQALKGVKTTFVPLAPSCSAILIALSVHAQAQTAPPPNQPVAAPKPTVVGAVKMAKVYFVSPKEGETVPSKFKAKFAVEGMQIRKVGDMTPGTGHFHVLIDTPPSKEGEAVPVDANHLHFGQGQTEADLGLAPGKHTLVLQFADGAHRAFEPQLSQEIHITVK